MIIALLGRWAGSVGSTGPFTTREVSMKAFCARWCVRDQGVFLKNLLLFFNIAQLKWHSLQENAETLLNFEGWVRVNQMKNWKSILDKQSSLGTGQGGEQRKVMLGRRRGPHQTGLCWDHAKEFKHLWKWEATGNLNWVCAQHPHEEWLGAGARGPWRQTTIKWATCAGLDLEVAVAV